jgi:fermentation-respiration switch protein FrsA (DUF1100 family)
MVSRVIAAAFSSCLLFSGSVSAQSAWWPFSWRPGQTLENALVFHPVRDAESWSSAPADLPVEDVWLRTADGTRIHAWWVPSPHSRGALLFCHGNAGNLSHRARTIGAVRLALGESVLIFDYPGYGKSEGQPSESGCCAAADAAFDWLTQTQNIPAERIILFGESLGGGVAADLAVRRPHRALVLVKTFASVPDMARNSWMTSASAAVVRNRFDNLAKIGRCRGPVVIAHGDRDEVIPLAQAKELYQKAQEPKWFCLLSGARHNDPLPAYFLMDLAAFLENPSQAN